VRGEAERIIQHVASGGYDVVGELDELRPRSSGSERHPDEVTSEDLLEAALDALASVTERHATYWWNQKRADARVESAGSSSRLSSLARGVLFRARRRGAELADRHRLAEWTVRALLRVRARTRRATASGKA